MFKVISVSDTLKLIESHFYSIQMPLEEVSAAEAHQRFLAENIQLAEDIPSFNRSTVDGYAVKSKDVQGCSESIPAILQKLGEVLMGEMSGQVLEAGQTFYLPTGAALPEGANAVVMVEDTELLSADEIAVFKPAATGQNLIFRGEDGQAGDLLLEQGRRLNAGDLGSLALMGRTRVKVFQKPRVAVISTGDEVQEAGSPLDPGKIYDVNAPLLLGLLKESGAEAIAYPIVPDQEEALLQALQKASHEADLVLISGGTSVGIRDALPRCIEASGKVLLHGIAVKPGKPTLIGFTGGKPVFGLPGNPVAVFFIYKHFVAPLLARMQGGQLERFQLSAELSRAVSSNHGREEFVLARYQDGLAEPIPSKSGLISTVSKANSYFIVPRDTEGYARGSRISLFPLEG